jgi:hypothetical protein
MILSSGCQPWRPERHSDPAEDQLSYTTPRDTIDLSHSKRWNQPRFDTLVRTRTVANVQQSLTILRLNS